MKASAYQPSVPVTHHHYFDCPSGHCPWPDGKDKASRDDVRLLVLLLLLLPLLLLLLLLLLPCSHLKLSRSVREEVHNGIITHQLPVFYYWIQIECLARGRRYSNCSISSQVLKWSTSIEYNYYSLQLASHVLLLRKLIPSPVCRSDEWLSLPVRS